MGDQYYWAVWLIWPAALPHLLDRLHARFPAIYRVLTDHPGAVAVVTESTIDRLIISDIPINYIGIDEDEYHDAIRRRRRG